MENIIAMFSLTAEQMIALFLIMAVGYLMYKRKVIDDAAVVRFTRLVLNISLPAQIISSFSTSIGVVSSLEVAAVFGISVLSYVIYAAVGVVFLAAARVPKDQRGTYFFMLLFANVGFMGLPVISTLFGESVLIYAVILNGVFNILVYSVGISLIGGRAGFRFNPKLLLNMPLLSTVAAMLLFFAGIRLPQTVITSLNYMGNVTTPVAMLILGATIATMPVRELLDDWRIYVFTAFRLALIPLAVLAVLRGLHLAQPAVEGVMIVLAAMPVATNTTMLAIEYGGDMHLASKGIFFSTVLSVVSIPLITLLL